MNNFKNDFLNIHYLQHVPFEKPAYIEEWAIQKNHNFTGTHFYKNDILPDINKIDRLVIMGGPMNIYEEDKFPWLSKEKEFIKQAIDKNRVVIGICLGSQLIADVLGSMVFKNKHKEIGWFPVRLSEEAKENQLFNFLPDEFSAFHWHGETYNIPVGAFHIAESQACKNQAFIYRERVIGLQFHFEMTAKALNEICNAGKEELVKEIYVQSEDEIKNNHEYIAEANKLMNELLNRLEKIT